MSRDERPSSAESVSGLFAREGGGFDSTGESIHFGCSMLSRIRMRPRKGATVATMRCHLGYALHSDEEVAKCLAVDGPSECWKVTPTWRVPLAAAPQAAIVAIETTTEPVAPCEKRGAPAEVVVIDTTVEPAVEVKVVQFRQPPRPTGTDHSEAD